MLGEIENYILNLKFKIALNDKDKQLVDLRKLRKAAKSKYQKVLKKKKQLREYNNKLKKRRIQTTKNSYKKIKTIKI